MRILKILAKSISYDTSYKRSLKNVLFIVIHYTGNKGDTAKGNATYFANGNTRAAGAHFFVDKTGKIYKSINMNRVAFAVGGDQRSGKSGEAKYYKQCTNANSISIELCDCVNGTNWEQMLAVRQLVLYIQKKCPNAKNIIRHWDVNGKACPAPMIGKNNEKWNRFHKFMTNGYQFKAEVTKKAAIRTSGKVTATNKIKTVPVGTKVNIAKVVGNWGRLKEKTSDGKYRWITLSKLREI